MNMNRLSGCDFITSIATASTATVVVVVVAGSGGSSRTTP
jgi:hypothetical protein